MRSRGPAARKTRVARYASRTSMATNDHRTRTYSNRSIGTATSCPTIRRTTTTRLSLRDNPAPRPGGIDRLTLLACDDYQR